MTKRKTLHRQNVPTASGQSKHRHNDSYHAKDNALDPSVFYICSWLSSPTPYLLYRLLMAGSILCFIGWDILQTEDVPWIFFGSNWSIAFLAVYFTWGAALIATHRTPVQKTQGAARKSLLDRKPQHSPHQQPSQLPWHFRAYRAFAITTYTGNLLTSTVYAVLLISTYGLGPQMILKHVVNSVITIVDVIVSQVPVQLDHYVYFACVSTIYFTSTLIYWAVGQMAGSDNIVYWFLDYTKAPGQAVVAIISLNLLSFGLHCVLVGVSKAGDTLFNFIIRKDGAA